MVGFGVFVTSLLVSLNIGVSITQPDFIISRGLAKLPTELEGTDVLDVAELTNSTKDIFVTSLDLDYAIAAQNLQWKTNEVYPESNLVNEFYYTKRMVAEMLVI